MKLHQQPFNRNSSRSKTRRNSRCCSHPTARTKPKAGTGTNCNLNAQEQGKQHIELQKQHPQMAELMRCFTSQRSGLWILIVLRFFDVFLVFRFCMFFVFFWCFFPVVFPLLLHCLWMVFFLCCFLVFSVYHALFDVLVYFSSPGFPISSDRPWASSQTKRPIAALRSKPNESVDKTQEHNPG